MRLPLAAPRTAGLRTLLGAATAWRPSEALWTTEFPDAALPVRVPPGTSPATGVVEAVGVAVRSSAATALRFEEAVEAMRDAEARVMGARSQSSAAGVRRTQPRSAGGLGARQPDLAAEDLASSGEWRQSVTFGSPGPAVNASGRAARSRRAAAADRAGILPPPEATLGLLLCTTFLMMICYVVVVCVENCLVIGPPRLLRTRERPVDRPVDRISGEAARRADVEGPEKGAGPQPAKREVKASTAPGGPDRGGPLHQHASELQGSNSELRPARASVETPVLTAALLCPQLQVPEGARLNCVLENDVCRRRQEMAFNVRGVGGAHLFQVRVAETTNNTTPGIFVETLGGEALLAFLSTEEVWQDVARPTLNIFWPSGVHYGTMQKTEEDEYTVQQNGSVVLVYAGDFASHSVRIKSRAGRTVGSVSRDSTEEYQVVVHTFSDVGLIILGALAIDKCEMEPAWARPPSSVGTASDVGALIGGQHASLGRRQSRESVPS